ncbi:serine protease [Halorhodospira halochloris]|uniref:trypsin-like serine peptidase n=1 Tax=Halorhodospira halochloris TaxID=1052 RepID=UPI001EE7D902|nr:serine protease [Halorhodospira halochloris]MCG5531444.1 serine protease [Halorhodospira halochloris]
MDERERGYLDPVGPLNLGRADTLWRLHPERRPQEAEGLTLLPFGDSAPSLERDEVAGFFEQGGLTRVHLDDGGHVDLIRAEAFDFELIDADGSKAQGDLDWFREQVTERMFGLEPVLSSGQRYEPVELSAEMPRPGVESATFRLEQGDVVREQRVELDGEVGERAQATFTPNWEFGPGPVTAEVILDTGEHYERRFGLYEDLEGRDLQWQVTDMRDPAHEPIGRLRVEQQDEPGAQVGTGFLISPQHVLTSAHVLSGEDFEADLDALETVTFERGDADGVLDGDRESFAADHIYLQDEEWEGAWPDEDLAIVRLEESLEDAPVLTPFWNTADDPQRDLEGEPVYWSGYPAHALDQGQDEQGHPSSFAWTAEGTVAEYVGAEDGGLVLSTEAMGVGGASGSPVLYEHPEQGLQVIGVYAGRFEPQEPVAPGAEDEPVASNLDPAAFDWALSVLESDGYGDALAYADAPIDQSLWGPQWSSGPGVVASAEEIAALG